jgi:hypothetical protein
MSEPTTNPTPGAAAQEPAATQTANPNPGTQIYTAEELTKQVQEQTQKTLTEERAKWEKDHETKVAAAVAAAQEEAAKLAKMTEDEKAKAALQKQQADLDAKAQALAMKEIRMDAAAALTEKNLPADALDFVVGQNTETTTANIEKFAKIFGDAVQKAVEDRLKGTTPSGGSGSGGAVDTSKMTDEEYFKYIASQKK